jgi:hypothetical protein
MKALKSLVVLIVLSSLLAGCEKWKDLIHKEKEKEKEKEEERSVYSAEGLYLGGENEVPKNPSQAWSTMDVSYSKITKMLKYTVRWSGLTGNPIGSHIHGTAPKGVNAGIKHDFTALIPKTTTGTVTNSVLVDGVAIKEDSLLKGFYYINIHTPTYPGGEIRGQIELK